MKPAKPLEKPDLYLVARFLDRLWAPEGQEPVVLAKARLQVAVGLKYELFVRYLDFLVSRGFIEISTSTKLEHPVRLTEAGRAAHGQLVGWLLDVFGASALEPRGRPSAASIGRPSATA